MLILMDTFSSSEYDNAGFDRAVVKIEEQEAVILATILKKYKAMKELEPKLRLAYFDPEDVECEFYECTMFQNDDGHDLLPESVVADMDKQGWAIIPEELEGSIVTGLDLSPKYAKDCDNLQLIIIDEGFSWRAEVPHSDLTIDTQVVDPSVLAQVL